MVLMIFAIDCTNLRLFWHPHRRDEITKTTKTLNITISFVTRLGWSERAEEAVTAKDFMESFYQSSWFLAKCTRSPLRL